MLPGAEGRTELYNGEITGQHLEKELHTLLEQSPAARQEQRVVLEKYLEIAKNDPDTSDLPKQVSESLTNLKNFDRYIASICFALAGSNRWTSYDRISSTSASN